MLVVAVNGSPNRDGNCAYLINYIENALVEKGIDFKLINAADVLKTSKTPFCVVCSNPCNCSCFKGTDLGTSYDLLTSADFIIAASPVYFGTISAQLKAFFDKTRDLRGKKLLVNKYGSAITVGASRFGGQETTVRAIHDIFLVHGMNVVGDGGFEFGAGHNGVCAARPASEDSFALERANALIERITLLNKG